MGKHHRMVSFIVSYKKRRKQRGLTYIIALFMVAVVAAGVMVAVQSTSAIVKRQKETRLLFVGNAIVAAIKSYHSISPGIKHTYPSKLDDLLLDRRFIRWPPRRHLRKIYYDPMTGSANWKLILDKEGNIMGVHSLSEKEPLKKDNFLKENRHFTGKTQYSEWRFIHE